MPKIIKLKNYTNFLNEIKNRIHSAQYEALKTVNQELIRLYWDIGKKLLITKENTDGENPLLKRSPEIYKQTFQACKVFLLKTSGICGNFMLNIIVPQISNHWLEKLVGQNI
jgi:hypothetical protein